MAHTMSDMMNIMSVCQWDHFSLQKQQKTLDLASKSLALEALSPFRLNSFTFSTVSLLSSTLMPCTKLSPSYSNPGPSSESCRALSSLMVLNLEKYFLPSSRMSLQSSFSALKVLGLRLWAQMRGQRTERMFMWRMGLKQESCLLARRACRSTQNSRQLHSRPHDSTSSRLPRTLPSFSSTCRNTIRGSQAASPSSMQVRQSTLLRYFPSTSPLLSRCLIASRSSSLQFLRSSLRLQRNCRRWRSFPKTMSQTFSWPMSRQRLMQRMQQLIEFFSTWSVLDLGGIRQIPSFRFDVLICLIIPSYIFTANVVICLSSPLFTVSMKDCAKTSRSLSEDLAPPRLAIMVGIYTLIAWGQANFIIVYRYSSAVRLGFG